MPIKPILVGDPFGAGLKIEASTENHFDNGMTKIDLYRRVFKFDSENTACYLINPRV